MATDTILDRQVAVKLLKASLADDPVVVERFRREAVAAAGLNHPYIVSIYDTVEDAGREAVVMELVPGRSLRSLLDSRAVSGSTRRSSSGGRWPPPSSTPTSRASSTATSSRATCW